MKNLAIKSFAVLLLLSNAAFAAIDPLPSWNDTAPKKAVISFVENVTRPDSRSFVPVEKRIATFDNDGTLWSEQPVYFQYFFAFDQIKTLAPQHPEWTTQEPFASILKGDMKSVLAGGDNALMAMFIGSQAGMTTDEYEKAVTQWLAAARHPRNNRLFTEMVYQPMLELLSYLRANGFKTYIVSGGDIEFIRPWTETAYGIPPEQVIGSSLKKRFELQNGKPVIVSLPELNFIDEKENKPVGIQSGIGRRPIASFGNSDGDLQMMQWTSAGTDPNLCVYVHHTDPEREWAYDRGSPVGRFDKGLDEAQAKSWTIVSMKDDWKIIYPFEKK